MNKIVDIVELDNYKIDKGTFGAPTYDGYEVITENFTVLTMYIRYDKQTASYKFDERYSDNTSYSKPAITSEVSDNIHSCINTVCKYLTKKLDGWY